MEKWRQLATDETVSESDELNSTEQSFISHSLVVITVSVLLKEKNQT